MTITVTRTPQGSVVQRTNECTNPSMESGIASWSVDAYGTGGAGSISQWTAQASNGTDSLRMNWTTAPTDDGAGFRYAGLPWVAGTLKTVSGYLWQNTGATRNGRAAIIWLDSTGANIGTTYPPAATPVPSSTWTRVSLTAQAPVGTVTAIVRFHLFGGAAIPVSSTLALDAVLFESTDQLLPYFDGTRFAGGTGAWTGTADASTSTLSVPDPNAQFSPVLVNGFDDQVTQGNIVHQLLSGAVAVVLRNAGPRSGTLKFLFATRTAAYAARAALQVAGVWAFLDTDTDPETNMRFVATGQSRVYQSDSRVTWLLDVPFQEVA